MSRPAVAEPPPAAPAHDDPWQQYVFKHRPGHGSTSTMMIQNVRDSRDKAQVLRVTSEQVQELRGDRVTSMTPAKAIATVIEFIDKFPFAVVPPIKTSPELARVRKEAQSALTFAMAEYSESDPECDEPEVAEAGGESSSAVE